MTYLLDSNIFINFLNGNKPEVDWVKTEKIIESSLVFSVISRIEILSLPSIKQDDIFQIEQFLSNFRQSYMSDEIILLSAALRRTLKLTLGDAIVTATAISNQSILVTNDKLLIKKVKNLVEVLSLS